MSLMVQEILKKCDPDAKEDAKKYICQKEIPQLFQAITIGLLHHRPADPVRFAQNCLDSVRFQTDVRIQWDTFLEWTPPDIAEEPRSVSAAVRKSTTPSAGTQGRGESRATDVTMGGGTEKRSNPFTLESDSGFGSVI